MHAILAVCLLLGSSAPMKSAALTERHGGCWETALTQGAMNACADSETRAADREMNRLYETLMKTKDARFKARLREAQRAWLTFRDAQVRSLYSDDSGGGSARPMCAAITLTDLTQERTKQLRALLPGTVEGDVCAPDAPAGGGE